MQFNIKVGSLKENLWCYLRLTLAIDILLSYWVRLLLSHLTNSIIRVEKSRYNCTISFSTNIIVAQSHFFTTSPLHIVLFILHSHNMSGLMILRSISLHARMPMILERPHQFNCHIRVCSVGLFWNQQP